MFDIPVHLFENFFRPAGQPDEARLVRKPAAADIARAFDCFQALSPLEDPPGRLSGGAASRCYTPQELRRLDGASRGLIGLVEASELSTPAEREWVSERLCALDEAEISQVKWIVLMALWSQGRDQVFVEDFLTGSAQGPLH